MPSYFEPLSEAEHERCNHGSGEPDYCANCGAEFMRHYNGQCPGYVLDQAMRTRRAAITKAEG